ncbi:odorant receptor 49b-like [Anoplophora glabripennis]|uniref:odorant receptor 49b-like n=1 Tax=Anoplophora glabripennis TaxID=217634 RepID=UPI000C792CDD|nr:odorant receptor 49b-like [Anoplophora glabripennis]
MIVSVAAQFRLVNLKIEDLNARKIENDHDLRVYKVNLKSIIKYQQFLIRFVDDLNKLLTVPIALLMVSSVTMICSSLYVRTTHQGSVFEEGRFFIIIFIVTAEFFLIYGLPAQLLMNESEATADTLYSECKWYSPQLRSLRKNFLIMMIRSQKSICIRAGHYHVINNRTILLMMKTAYTFHTFLQEVT